MPVYEYECKGCDQVFEVQQRITDEPVSSCPECGGPVTKIMSVNSFQLKGSGWYADGYSSAGSGKEKKGSACPAAKGCSSCCSAPSS